MYFNVLSVIRKDSYLTTSFNVARIVDKVLDSMDCYPLYTEEFPKSLVSQNPKRLKNLNQVYTDFTERSDADFRATVDLNKAPKFAIQHARHAIRSRFKNVPGAILSQNFINDIDILLPASKQDSSSPCTKYYGFSVRPQLARITDGLEFVAASVENLLNLIPDDEGIVWIATQILDGIAVCIATQRSTVCATVALVT